MPIRRGIGGLFSGGGDVLNEFLRQNIADENAQRNDLLERGRQADEMIAKGTLQPTDRGAYIGGRYTGPGVQDRLASIMGNIGKASSYETTPTAIDLGQQAEAAHIPNFVTPSSFPDRPDSPLNQPLPDASGLMQSSPEMQSLDTARRAKLQSFPPVKTGEDIVGGVPVSRYSKFNPDTGLLAQIQDLASGPTAEAKGTYEGTQALTAENVKRPGEVQTAREKETATKQAGEDVTNLPSNQQARARGAALQTGAQKTAEQNAELTFVKSHFPDAAKPFISTTATNRPYAYVEPSLAGTPMQRMQIVQQLQTGGVKVVTQQQQSALQSIDAARANYDSLMGQFEGHLAKDAKGRPLNALKNTLGTYLQTDPQLAAAVATDFPLIIANLKAIAGTVGRIMQVEVNNMSASIPGPKDTWATAQSKKLAMARQFANVENSILGAPPPTTGQ